jgi:hypothetical protein
MRFVIGVRSSWAMSALRVRKLLKRAIHAREHRIERLCKVGQLARYGLGRHRAVELVAADLPDAAHDLAQRCMSLSNREPTHQAHEDDAARNHEPERAPKRGEKFEVVVDRHDGDDRPRCIRRVGEDGPRHDSDARRWTRALPRPGHSLRGHFQ